MPLRKIFMTKPFLRLVAMWLLITAATLAVTASCDDGGMYQGGGDSVPGWRK